MVTIVNSNTGKVLRAQFNTENLGVNEISIPELQTSPFIVAYFNFTTRLFYEGATPAEIAAAAIVVVPEDLSLANISYVDTKDFLKVDKVAGSRLITGAEATVLGNTSNSNSGDNAPNSQYSGLATSKENSIPAGAATQYFRGDKTFQTLDKTAVGLANVDNTSDVAKPVSTAQANAIALKQNSLLNNFSVASQAPVALTRTYITGSKITVPVTKLAVGTMFRWTIDLTKTLAGTGTTTFDICVGTAGTTADTARMIFIKPAGTAAVDAGKVVIECIVRSIGVAGISVGQFNMTHNLASTGHMTIPCANVTTVSAGFDTTVANLFVGVCITTGLADVITIQMVKAEVLNL